MYPHDQLRLPPTWVRRPGFLALAAVLLLAAPLAAEEPETLYLKGGNRLSGLSLGISDGMVRWRLPEDQEIAVPLSAIERIQYSPNDWIGTPEVPHAEALSATDVGEAGGTKNDSGTTTRIVQAAYEQFSEACDVALHGVEDWTKRLQIGARFLDGNSNEDSIDFGANFEQKKRRRLTQLDFSGQYAKTESDVLANRWTANGNIDFDRDGNWILFVASKNETDELENLTYRGTISSGLGYRFINEDDKRLIVRVGPGVTHERYHDPVMNRTTPDAFGELELRSPLFDRTHFEHKTTVNPSAEDLSVFRLVSNYGLLIDLDDDEKWSLKFGVRHEYNSEPNEDRKPNDYTSSILIVYQRK